METIDIIICAALVAGIYLLGVFVGWLADRAEQQAWKKGYGEGWKKAMKAQDNHHEQRQDAESKSTKAGGFQL